MQISQQISGSKPHKSPPAKVIRLPNTGKARRKSPKPRKTREQRFNEKVDRSAGLFGHWLWTGSVMQANGYGQIRDISPVTGKPTMRNTHVVAWEVWNGQTVPRGKQILHAPGCPPTCCNPLHLRIGTQGENEADKKLDGTSGRRLKNAEVLEIVRRANAGETIGDLSSAFRVQPKAIKRILRGLTHSKLTGIQYVRRKGGRPPKLKLIVSKPAAAGELRAAA